MSLDRNRKRLLSGKTYCMWIDEGSSEVDKKVAFDNYTDNVICRNCRGCIDV